MRYEISDMLGDPIVVTPLPPEGIIPRAHIRFTVADEDGEPMAADMVLNDRQIVEFKQALNRSIRESARIG